jgi:hypothetical protein
MTTSTHSPELKAKAAELKAEALKRYAQKCEGMITLAQVATIMNCTEHEVRNMKDAHLIYALPVDGELLFPNYQFKKDDIGDSYSILYGVSQLLNVLKLGQFSPEMKASFFSRPIYHTMQHYPNAGKEVCVIDILKEGNISYALMDELQSLAKLFGTMDPA